MTFVNKKDFYATMFALNENKTWFLIATMPMLSTRFVDEAKKIKKTHTEYFKKKLLKNTILFLTAVLLIWVAQSNAPEQSGSIKAFIVLILMLCGLMLLAICMVNIFSYIDGKWQPNYEDEAYSRYKEISQNVVAQLESSNTTMNQKVREENQQWQLINNTSEIHDIKSILKGSTTTIHPIDYMADDALLKYWNEVEKPRLLKEKDKAMNEFLAASNQLEKEIEFCNSI